MNKANRGLGRPFSGRTVALTAKVEPEVKEAIKAMAKRAGVTPSALVAETLAKAVSEAARKRKAAGIK